MTEHEKAELADVYEKAAEYLEKYGWTQDTFGERGGPACFRGAIIRTSGYGTSISAAIVAVKILELEEDCLIEDWNDTPGRTADEVINTLHALANKPR